MEDGKNRGRGSVGTSLLRGEGENIGDFSSGEIARALEVLFEPGKVVELRAFKDRTTVSGYFDDFEELAEQAAKLDGRGFAVYVTLNPVREALLARSQNRVKSHPKATTSDVDIVARRWLPVDFFIRVADTLHLKTEEKDALVRSWAFGIERRSWPHSYEDRQRQAVTRRAG